MPSSGPDHFGQYEILERIASGGMAELYKAKRTGVEGFQKIVAIKKILPHLADDEEFITMFADEAKLAAQLNHPNIIHIYDLGKIQAGGYFIAMEYVDGRDLRAIQKSGRELGVPLPVSLAVYIASKVASALDYAHRRRDADGQDLHIVHRDVSPQNILISYEGDIKLCDFGIAKATSKASQTQSGALKGKLQYMSPEQAWAKPIDRRSDLFSLGVVLHELLTGDRLFRGDTDIQVLEKVRSAEVTPPSRANPEVPKNLDGVVLRCLAKDPEERYANASDLLRDLDSVLYSYSPAPGSADVAIYLHRLQAEETAVAEARAREAAQAQAQSPAASDETARRRKSKAVPVRRTGPAPKAVEPPAPAPPPPPTRPARPAPPPRPGAVADLVSRDLRLGGARRGRDRQAHAALHRDRNRRRGPGGLRDLEGDEDAGRRPRRSSSRRTPPRSSSPRRSPLRRGRRRRRPRSIRRRSRPRCRGSSPPSARSSRRRPRRPPPQEGGGRDPRPSRPPRRPRRRLLRRQCPRRGPSRRRFPRSRRRRSRPHRRRTRPSAGDLVGPGPGVIEPVLSSVPRVNYPPLAKERRIAGKVVVLVQVDENGRVLEARVQQGLPGRTRSTPRSSPPCGMPSSSRQRRTGSLSKCGDRSSSK